MIYMIEQNIIPGLPKVPYDNGHYVGVVAHSTANNGCEQIYQGLGYVHLVAGEVAI